MSSQPGETTRTVAVEDLDPLSLFGRNDANLRLVERSYPVHLTFRDGKIATAHDYRSHREALKAAGLEE